MPIRLIVGLGNPGQSYAETRHNTGNWFISLIKQSYTCSSKLETKFKATITKLEVSGSEIYLLEPNTYMNDSGLPVKLFSNFLKIPTNEILVAHDELDLPVNSIKLKFAGGHGGHNGLRDIIQHLGKDFYRLRIGIGHPGNKDDVSTYVLEKPSTPDRTTIMYNLDNACLILKDIISDIDKAMNQLNTKI